MYHMYISYTLYNNPYILIAFYKAIVFNTCGSSHVMLPEVVRAFLRHAVGRYYAAVTKIDKEGGTFNWQATFHQTLFKFREAAVRWALHIKHLYIHRTYSHLTEQVPSETLVLFSELINFDSFGSSFTVAPGLTQEIANAAKAAENFAGHN